MGKKRAANSTKGRTGRKTTPAKATDPAPVKAKVEAKVHPSVETKTVEPVEKAPKVRAKFTLGQAIEWFKKDPHPEEFFCTGAPGFALVKGDFYLKFEKGQFVTSDPTEVEILMQAREYNFSIFAVNVNLRNLKR